tara:strand:- start:1619 stop:2725 length:1107 start_codon:yes stop_codon:yes gene_type:complete
MNVHAWSGTGYYMAEALKQSGLYIERIGNLKEFSALLFKIKKQVFKKFFKNNYHWDREPSVLISYARQVENSLLRLNPDVVFSPGTIPIAYLKTEKPLIFWTDATFAGMIDFYPEFTNLNSQTIYNGNIMEQKALSKCRLAIYSSEWAANTALSKYQVEPHKIKVVPFGANIINNYDFSEIKRKLKSKKFNKCKLLFIGLNWIRKGGDIALKITKELNKMGLNTELHVVGCTPPIKNNIILKKHGFLSKSNENDRKKLDKLFSESHFLLLPTRSDCVPVVLSEANSFGLPCITTDVGGIPTAIKDGINGKIFSIQEDYLCYCNYIINLMTTNEDYNKLALSSFQEYKNRLNWKSSSTKVKELINEYCV